MPTATYSSMGPGHRPGALDQQVGEQGRGGVDLGVPQLPQPVDLVHQVGQCGRRPTRSGAASTAGSRRRTSSARSTRTSSGASRRPGSCSSTTIADRRKRVGARPQPEGVGAGQDGELLVGLLEPERLREGDHVEGLVEGEQLVGDVAEPAAAQLGDHRRTQLLAVGDQAQDRAARRGDGAGAEQQEPIGGGFDRDAAQALAHLHADLRAHRTVGPRQGDHGRRLLGVGWASGSESEELARQRDHSASSWEVAG